MQELKLTKLTMVLDNTILLIDKYVQKLDQGYNIEGKDREFFNNLKLELSKLRATI